MAVLRRFLSRLNSILVGFTFNLLIIQLISRPCRDIFNIFVAYTFKLALGQNFEQFPAQLERLFDCAVDVKALRNVLFSNSSAN